MTSQSVSSMFHLSGFVMMVLLLFLQNKMHLTSSFNFEVNFFTYISSSTKECRKPAFTSLSVTANDLWKQGHYFVHGYIIVTACKIFPLHYDLLDDQIFALNTSRHSGL